MLRSSGSGANITWGTHLTEDGSKFVINYNAGTIAGSLPSNTRLWLAPADSAGAKAVIDGYGDNPAILFRLSLGTGASPTAITTGLQMGIFGSRGWDGTAWSGNTTGFALATTENWNNTSHGSKIQLFVTKNGTVSLVEAVDIDNDGGVKVQTSAGADPTGGSKGPGTINVAGGYYVNGVPLGGGVAGLNGLWAPAMSATPTQANTGFTSWFNQLASSTVINAICGVTVFAPSQANNNRISAIIKNSAGSGVAKQYIACIARTAHPNSFTGVYFGWSDGTKVHGMGVNGSAPGAGIVVNHWSNATTYVAQDGAHSPGAGALIGPIWLQLIDDGTNIGFGYGFDGQSWNYVFSQARSAGYLGSTGYTKIIFGCNPYDATIYSTLMSYAEG
jgi:hypothetical protein